MEVISFLNQFIKHPRNTGAVAPSSKALAQEMVVPIDFCNAKTIVELGPGTGVLTSELVKQKAKETQLILLEVNETFYHRLQREYADHSTVRVIHGSAENLRSLMSEWGLMTADVILSGLPFTSLPADVTQRILKDVRRLLAPHGLFVAFQYSLAKKKLIQRFFPEMSSKKVWLNIPPAYVLTCKKEPGVN